MTSEIVYDKYDRLFKEHRIKKLVHPTKKNIEHFCSVFGINNISIIYRPYYSDHYFPFVKNDSVLKILKHMFQNKNMWLLVFEEMSFAIFITEATLRKLNYFDAFIRQYQTERMNDKNYFQIPSGAHIYNIYLNDDPFTQILYYSTFKSLDTTFIKLNETSLPNLISKIDQLDPYLIESFSGIKNIDSLTEN
jgi:hypothetical protein